MTSAKKYRVVLTTFEPRAQTTTTEVWSVEDALCLISLPTTSDVVIVVEVLGNGIDYGNFYLFANRYGRAHVVLHEHREFKAFDPKAASDPAEMEFLSEDGVQFFVESHMTLSQQQAYDALSEWLPMQHQTEKLQWV